MVKTSRRDTGTATVKSLTDEQGWIHTGDIGEIGPDGNIYFRGRSKETIVTAAGLKIYPTDLEAALDRQPEIKASAVIPLAGQRHRGARSTDSSRRTFRSECRGATRK